MPTFDQLPPEQRAIIELVLQRGRSYDDLADALAITPERVRELAVDALVELSPRTANRVEAQRRPQVADYVLNQQSSAESTATRSFLKRSEAGRMWILSLMDSLEHMYADGAVPEIPEPSAEDEERPRRRERERPSRERTRELPARKKERDEDEDEEREPPRGDRARGRAALRDEPDRDRDREAGARRREALTPEAERAVRNRRIVAAVGALLLIAALTVGILALTGVFDADVREARAPTTRVVGQLLLNPLDRDSGEQVQGIAVVAQRGDERSLIVQARLKPTERRQAYEVWLYNDDKDAVSLGAQVTDREGNYQGAGRLPAPLDKYKFIDVSLEQLDRNQAHSGNSILRGEIANLQSPQEAAQQQGGAQQPPAGGQQQPPPAGGGTP
jgi:hypothetical protein